jgi:septum formation protein
MIEKSGLLEHFPKIVLASASPRRANLLKQIGLEFQICPSRVDESAITNSSPDTAVQELALTKAKAVAGNHMNGLVIGADTVVVINRRVIGKPEHAAHAVEILTQLSGVCHEVMTGVALVDLERRREVVWQEKTVVQFRKLHRREILTYVNSGEAVDKAGAYGVQGRAAAFVERIEGCYFNVVGLPLASLVERLWNLASP